ncbi:type VII secretion protein EccB [Mycobacterium sp. TNTM28]|uniref:Type VII secretion protein EccB n=1 Tax=[Mycobacterium] fortunisiensis TaxID=2600579 RepID=A0ABS6KJR6_9MYCO|nr:type VII secretion protein EccB [[Mycobacterium] fortunisiensis]MBU9763775.1 type VII secretion protein EccB [[Mycobacterium] fortunisiensis]
MAGRTATRLQLSGHRFLLRRMAHALVRGDARMLDDPVRAQAVAYGVGGGLAAVVIAVGAVLALVRPDTVPRDAPILMVRDTGALYVRIDDAVHPVLNLASARLIVGRSADPVVVSAKALAELRPGPLVGIAGAPAQIGRPLDIDETGWAICDLDENAETVLRTGAGGDGTTPLPSGAALLVSARTAGAPTYLLLDGRRARIDIRDTAVVRALHLEGVRAQPVSQALLDSVPEAPAVRAPVITGVGAEGPAALHGLTVGTVVQVSRSGPAELYVVLVDGLQRVGRVAADVIRFSVPQPGDEPPVVAADVVADLPIAEDLTAARFPERVLGRGRAVVCAHWDPSSAGEAANTTVTMSDSISEGGVRLAQADGAAPNIDRVQIPPGRSVLVQADGVLRGAPVDGPLYLLNDRGVLFGVRDGQTAEHLGLAAGPVPAPWPMLARLPRGPALSRDAAAVMRDALPGVRMAPA